MSDLISRQAVIDILNQKMREMPPERYADYYKGLMVANGVVQGLPSAQPEVIRCKDCRKHNVHSGYKDDCCALYEWRGVSYGHEHDYQYCSFAERRTDGTDR